MKNKKEKEERAQSLKVNK